MSWMDDLMAEDDETTSSDSMDSFNESNSFSDDMEQGFGGMHNILDDDDLSASDVESIDSFGSTTADTEEQEEAPTVTLAGKTFGYKGVAIIIAGILIVVALVFLFFDKIHISSKSDTQPQKVVVQQTTNTQQREEQSQEQTQQTQATPKQQQQQQSQRVENNSSEPFKVVPPDTEIDYNVEELIADGQVTNKTTYISNGQLLYCIDIVFNDGKGRRKARYFCGFSVFDAVQIADEIQVKYQQVSEKVVSITNISL